MEMPKSVEKQGSIASNNNSMRTGNELLKHVGRLMYKSRDRLV